MKRMKAFRTPSDRSMSDILRRRWKPMCQESAGTSDENKAAMPKKGKLFFTDSAHRAAAAALRYLRIGAAGIAQWRLYSEEPGPGDGGL